MPIMRYPKCWRGRTDCEPFQAIDATSVDPSSLTEQQMYELDYPVEGFICCGCVKEEARILPQDAYRLCFKTARGVDDMTDNDEQDLAHLATVITHALGTIASRRVNSGRVRVLDDADGLKAVRTEQAQDERSAGTAFPSSVEDALVGEAAGDPCRVSGVTG